MRTTTSAAFAALALSLAAAVPPDAFAATTVYPDKDGVIGDGVGGPFDGVADDRDYCFNQSSYEGSIALTTLSNCEHRVFWEYNLATVSLTRPVPATGIDVGWGDPTGLCGTCHASWLQAYDFHAFCTACQTCHAHGAAFGEDDFVGTADDTPCPMGLAPSGTLDRLGAATNAGDRAERPLHQAGGRLAPIPRAFPSGQLDMQAEQK